MVVPQQAPDGWLDPGGSPTLRLFLEVPLWKVSMPVLVGLSTHVQRIASTSFAQKLRRVQRTPVQRGIPPQAEGLGDVPTEI